MISATRGSSRADDDAVGLHEVVERSAFLHELRVGDHVEVLLGLGGDRRADLRSAVPTGTVDLSTMIL